jgi:pimeloyl-ACP methyl ester carboxylesterase
MKKFFTVVFITIGSMIGVVALALGTTAIVNVVATNSEAANLTPYGQLVEVDGKNMNVVVRGSGAETVVLLTGFATAAPGLDFEPLIEQLEDDYRVVAVEPFGYGLSDDTDVPRTTENIVSEVHQALQELDIDRYVLMGHSISGIYALDYVNRYPDEVSAFVGIDSSVPTQPGMDEELPISDLQTMKSLGLLRILDSIGPDQFAGLPYSDEMKDQMKVLSLRNSFNSSIASESKHTFANFVAAQAQEFPVDLPVLLFVLNDDDVPGWVQLHQEQVDKQTTGEMVLLDGDHYLHHTQSAVMAQKLGEFLAAQQLAG